MRAPGLVFVFFIIANQLTAGTLELCVENPARLDEFTLRAFQTELGNILDLSGRPATFTPCRPGVVTITLRRQPPDEESSALGRTRHVNGRLVPDIELFAAPTVQIVGTVLPGVLGRAMARVATHELGHWLSQGSGHSTRGFMMERLSAAHLMASDRGLFRLPPGD
jgi:hypothetical protein